MIIQALPQQQQPAVYQTPPGFVPPFPGGPYDAAPGPGPGPPPAITRWDKFAHLRGVPMFRLNAASDVPTHSHRINKTAYMLTKHMKIYRSVLTRWSTPSGGPTAIIVDVYQIRNPFSIGASPFQVHVSRDCQIRLGGRFDVSARRGRVWSKHFTKQAIEEVVMLRDGMAIPLEVVERKEERVAPEESEAAKKRFRSWSIPA
ncbi:hypothetical protein B0H67DRAFT_650044 [Lasiosphaeris hirsuta]|uniref:Uncharacterized protein n=1 Tax=Lasiosphaeris hirsuta TaxID=260670 RepID=A0AA39ZS83_9PEZI|nr:hypothetical protein B0H67DRAFT_650044 [Lasiosphaeris hirsuta]